MAIKFILYAAIASLVQLATCEPSSHQGESIYSGILGYKPVRTEVATTYYEPEQLPGYSHSTTQHSRTSSPEQLPGYSHSTTQHSRTSSPGHYAGYPQLTPQHSRPASPDLEAINTHQHDQSYDLRRPASSNRGQPPVAYPFYEVDSTHSVHQPITSHSADYVTTTHSAHQPIPIPIPSHSADYTTTTHSLHQPITSHSADYITTTHSAHQPIPIPIPSHSADYTTTTHSLHHPVTTHPYENYREEQYDQISRYDAPIKQLREMLDRDIREKGDYFDRRDVEELFAYPYILLKRYLNQRDFDIIKTRELIVNVLAWRKKLAINRLFGRELACELFRMGLIFEQKSSQSTTKNPVIWIRLGALGEAVKAIKSHRHSSTCRAVASDLRMAKSTGKKLLHGASRMKPHRTSGNHKVSQIANSIINHGSNDPKQLANDGTIQFILQSIAWWIDDWDHAHPLSKATLLFDFEGSDEVFSSSSIGSFLIQLDDRFPDLFGKIILFRYQPPVSWTLKHHVGSLNRIFLSRVAASDKTNKKTTFVGHKDEVQKYISQQRIKGVSDIPDYVLKTCNHRVYPVPHTCSARDLPYLAQNNPFIDLNSKIVNLIKEQLVRC